MDYIKSNTNSLCMQIFAIFRFVPPSTVPGMERERRTFLKNCMLRNYAELLKMAGLDYYKSDVFEFDRENVFFNPDIVKPNLQLRLPEGGNFFDKENARLLHEAKPAGHEGDGADRGFDECGC